MQKARNDVQAKAEQIFMLETLHFIMLLEPLELLSTRLSLLPPTKTWLKKERIPKDIETKTSQAVLDVLRYCDELSPIYYTISTSYSF